MEESRDKRWEKHKRELLEKIATDNGYDVETFIEQYNNHTEYTKHDKEIVINDFNKCGYDNCEKLIYAIAQMDVDVYGRRLDIQETTSVHVECKGVQGDGTDFCLISTFKFEKSHGEKMVEILESQKDELNIEELTECVKQYIDENF